MPPNLIIYFNQSNYIFPQHTTIKERSTVTASEVNTGNAIKAKSYKSW